MWFDILKNVKQSSRQMINLDWDDETVPEAEESDCLKELKEYYEKAKVIFMQEKVVILNLIPFLKKSLVLY